MIPEILKRQINTFIQNYGAIGTYNWTGLKQEQAMHGILPQNASDKYVELLRKQWNSFFSGYFSDKNGY